MNMPVYPATRPKVKPHAGQPQAVMTKEELEPQLIPTINTIRATLGKPPIIVPKGEGAAW